MTKYEVLRLDAGQEDGAGAAAGAVGDDDDLVELVGKIGDADIRGKILL